jgi:integrase/recombinase XerD
MMRQAAGIFRVVLSDYRNLGEQRVLRFREEGGKEREIPVRHDLEGWINEYVTAAGIAEDARSAPQTAKKRNSRVTIIRRIRSARCSSRVSKM